MSTKKTTAKPEGVKLSRAEYISYLALKSNEINMTNNNSKTGVACLTINFPTCVCREDAPCRATCYANKGCQKICAVQGAYYRNLRLYNDNPEDFFEQMAFKIRHSGLPLVRFFDSGDIPDYDFLKRAVNLCIAFPEVKFMMFTKKYSYVNTYIENLALGSTLPDNLNIVFSAWDVSWKIDNPYNLPVAYVKFNDERLTPEIPENAFHCPGRAVSCSACRACWNKKITAVFFDEH